MADNLKIIVGTKTEQSGEKMMQSLRTGKIKQHLLGNSALERYGYLEQKELSEYNDFLKTKFFFDIMQLSGSVDYE